MIETVARNPDQVSPSEEEVELVPRTICERINQDHWVWCVGEELSSNPFKCALMIVIGCALDAVVPLAEVVFLLVEELKFGNEEAIEVSVHESWGWLLERGELSPVEVGSEGAVAVGITEVGGVGVRVGAQRYQAR